MKWFKFYGQDWLTDLKIINMSMEDRLCFLTLLCLASAANDNGRVKGCDEETLIKLSHIPNYYTEDFNPYEKARGCLKRYVALHCVTLDDNGDVTIVNFTNRQGENLSNAERQKNYRERLKTKVKPRNDRYVTRYNDSNNRIDKNRIDKSNTVTDSEKPKKQYGDMKSVLLTDEEVVTLIERIGEQPLKGLIFELDTYIQSKGVKYKSHYATLLNWANRKSKEITKTKGRGLAQ